MASLSIKADLGEDINKLARATAFNLLTGIVKKTPVDTGRARGNWQLNLSTAKTDITNTLDKSGGLAISKGATAIDSAREVEYPVFWITNNLPYIGKLNDGHSKQAPAKFVDTEMKRVVNK